MVAASFSMATVGMPVLCNICINCVLLPATVQFFLDNNFHYKFGGIFILLYILFLAGINRQSTVWLKNSLKLANMLAYSTHQANFDLLTDLPNQRLLTKYIEEAIAKMKNTGENFILISFGINRLEMFNNSLGYRAGDLVISVAAKRLQAKLSELNSLNMVQRVLTRPRPDAFVIIMFPFASVDVRRKIEKEIEQLFLTLDEPIHLGTRGSRMTASVGVAIFPQDAMDPEKLLSNAYAAMFKAKEARGSKQIEFYHSDMTSHAPLMLELETDLHYALERKELEVYYQPIVDIRAGIISGMEALVRWNHPKKGLISPKDFIPLAEETGLIIPISEWVLEQAALQTVVWKKEKQIDLELSVNLSPAQLKQGNLLATLERILEKTKIDPQKLELELVENALLDDSLAPLIEEISQKGISLVIDDFGTGYSGLSYLKFFHIDKIKIDRSFIQDIVSNGSCVAIVTAVLAMAKEQGIKTLAEGVENKEQLIFLQERGCQYVQGYYFSEPVPVKAFEKLLDKGVSEKL